MINPDRATLDFLNSFSEESQKTGEHWHHEGCVTQIFGNYLLIRGTVETPEGLNIETSLTMRGNGWEGDSDSEQGRDCPGLYATMIERLERGKNLPESPNEIGDTPLPILLEESLGRELDDEEEAYLSKLEKRYRRFAIGKEIFDHDLIRLEPGWEVTGYDSLELWPSPPKNIAEFWNYIAYAFEKKGFSFPPFMKGVTDLSHTQSKLMSWEHEREVSEWSERIGQFIDGPGKEVDSRDGEFCLEITTNRANLKWRQVGSEEFSTLSTQEILGLVEKYDSGLLQMDSESELLWASYLNFRGKAGNEEIRLESELAGRFLNELFRRPSLSSKLVDLDGEPIRISNIRLNWLCDIDSSSVTGDWRLYLIMEDEEVVPHSLRLLPGPENLYLSDDAVFHGPSNWSNNTDVSPTYQLPREVVESATGVAFLKRAGARIPASLEERVDDALMEVTVSASIINGLSSAESEHLILKCNARDQNETRLEALSSDGWSVVEMEEPDNGRIMHYDRTSLHRVEPFIGSIASSYDTVHEAFKAKLSKTFPKKFTEWVESMPKGINLEADELIGSLLKDPVKASLRFEVVGEEIDWFDLKVVVNVDGEDLSEDEIRDLVEARGNFVRTKDGSWIRVAFDLGEGQREAVERLGIDPYDLSG